MEPIDSGDALVGAAADAKPAEAVPDPIDVASSAEREFVERVRRDRAQARALVRRSIVIGVLVVALAALFLGRRATPGPPGDNVAHERRAEMPQSPQATNKAATAPAMRESAPSPPAHADNLALEQRVERLEGRLGALEQHATASAAVTDTRHNAVRAASAVSAARSARTASSQPPKVKVAPVASPKRVTVSAPLRETVRRQTSDADGINIGERFRRGWETIERHVRRVPHEVGNGLRDGLRKTKRLFSG
jgi:hypothetical protein